MAIQGRFEGCGRDTARRARAESRRAARLEREGLRVQIEEGEAPAGTAQA